jgi:hypothetical protein
MLGFFVGALLCALGLAVITGQLYWQAESVLYALSLPTTTTSVGVVGLAALMTGMLIVTVSLRGTLAKN